MGVTTPSQATHSHILLSSCLYHKALAPPPATHSNIHVNRWLGRLRLGIRDHFVVLFWWVLRGGRGLTRWSLVRSGQRFRRRGRLIGSSCPCSFGTASCAPPSMFCCFQTCNCSHFRFQRSLARRCRIRTWRMASSLGSIGSEWGSGLLLLKFRCS